MFLQLSWICWMMVMTPKLAVLASSRISRSRCQMKTSPLIRTNYSDRTVSYLSPLVFRASNYGINKYNIDSNFQGYPVINIRLSNSAKPDSVTSKDLGSFYAFYRSFLSAEIPSIHQIDDKTPVLELWTVYILKKDTFRPTSRSLPLPLFVSVNVLFQIGNITSLRFNPITSGLTKLIKGKMSETLAYNYDLYALLPRKSSLAVYETSFYLFPYPHPTERGLPSGLCPTVKVHIFLEPMRISQEQYDMVRKAEKLLRSSFPSKLTSEKRKEGIGVKALLTPLYPLTLYRRAMSKGAAYILEFRQNLNGQAELDPYSSDCKYLENVGNVNVAQERSTASKVHHFSIPLELVFILAFKSVLGF